VFNLCSLRQLLKKIKKLKNIFRVIVKFVSNVVYLRHYFKCKQMTYKKIDNFEPFLIEIAEFSRVLSHPARLEILRYVASSKTCISGDISDKIPLSRSTVSQHLKELKKVGILQGEVDGAKICYCINKEVAQKCVEMYKWFFTSKLNCYK